MFTARRDRGFQDEQCFYMRNMLENMFGELFFLRHENMMLQKKLVYQQMARKRCFNCGRDGHLARACCTRSRSDVNWRTGEGYHKNETGGETGTVADTPWIPETPDASPVKTPEGQGNEATSVTAKPNTYADIEEDHFQSVSKEIITAVHDISDDGRRFNDQKSAISTLEMAPISKLVINLADDSNSDMAGSVFSGQDDFETMQCQEQMTIEQNFFSHSPILSSTGFWVMNEVTGTKKGMASIVTFGQGDSDWQEID